jgi:hypothetical protein
MDYPQGLPDSQLVLAELETAIKNLNPFKAAGPDGIPNVVIQCAGIHITPTLLAITNASLRLGYHPSSWKVFTTITLGKPGKSDYTIPKAYQLIALENTLGKVIASIVACWLSQLAEEFGLLLLYSCKELCSAGNVCVFSIKRLSGG